MNAEFVGAQVFAFVIIIAIRRVIANRKARQDREKDPTP